MAAANMMLVCLVAFVVVFTALAVLAAVMRAITAVFPVRSGGVDGAVLAAIASSVATLAPGARVTHIEEES